MKTMNNTVITYNFTMMCKYFLLIKIEQKEELVFECKVLLCVKCGSVKLLENMRLVSTVMLINNQLYISYRRNDICKSVLKIWMTSNVLIINDDNHK